MTDFGRFQGLSEAVKLKIAISDVAHYGAYGSIHHQRMAWQMAGISVKGMSIQQVEKMLLPVYTLDNRTFAQPMINGQPQVLMASAALTEGSLIEYRSSVGSFLGLVVEPPVSATKQGIYVKAVSAEEATDLHLSRPTTKHYYVDKTAVQPLDPEPYARIQPDGFWGGLRHFTGSVEKIFVESLKKVMLLLSSLVQDNHFLTRHSLLLLLAQGILLSLVFAFLVKWLLF